MTDPPKKKHPTRPREEVIRLSRDEQVTKAVAEFAKAKRKLKDAELLASRGDTPEPCAHAAYYAMYHAACAAILLNGGSTKRGDVPDNHRDVLMAFGRLVDDLPPPLKETGMMLSDALRLRMVADYVLGGEVGAGEADIAVKNARELLDQCQKHWPQL